MARLLFSRLSLIWFVLVAATAISWEMGHGIGLDDRRQAGIAIIVVAFIKVRLVLLEFMEIRTAPLFMRAVAEVWVLVIGGALVALFATSPA